MKTILYAVAATPTPNESTKIYTITSSKKDCSKYITRKLMMENFPHFSAWCALHGVSADETGWDRYVDAGIVPEEDFGKYSILRLAYGRDDLAHLMRVLNKCLPLGCDYERDDEYGYFLNSLEPELRTEIERRLSEEDIDVQ